MKVSELRDRMIDRLERLRKILKEDMGQSPTARAIAAIRLEELERWLHDVETLVGDEQKRKPQN